MDKEQIYLKIRAFGRAALTLGIENSHSGNISIKCSDENGNEMLAITAAGSQKGELTRDRICFASLDKVNHGYFKSSSETDIHARILNLPGKKATMHGHTKAATIVTLDDAPMPKENPRKPLIPFDPLGVKFLGEVPVDWFAVASGSKEMAETIAKRLESYPVGIVQAHGAFASGGSLEEAFFKLCLVENSGEVIHYSDILGVDRSFVVKEIVEAASVIKKNIPDYSIENDGRLDFGDEPDTVDMFLQTGYRIFESKYSPFHSGSMSVRCSRTMLYIPKASLPHDIQAPMMEVPLKPEPSDDPEMALHKAIYANTPLKSLLHCYVSEAQAVVLASLQTMKCENCKVIPIDAEGGFLYPSVPILACGFDAEDISRALLDYHVCIAAHGGAWASGEQSIGEALRHISSLKDICYYRIMAVMRGLDLSVMEPPRARSW